jgi:hypothetical protein
MSVFACGCAILVWFVHPLAKRHGFWLRENEVFADRPVTPDLAQAWGLGLVWLCNQ